MEDYLPPDDNMDLLPSPYISPGSNLANMDECSSGFQSAGTSNLASSLPSSSSTTVNEYPPQPCHLPPPPPPEPQSLLADRSPEKIIKELEELMRDRDWVVLANSSFFIYGLLINEQRSFEYCQLMSASTEILNHIYHVLENDHFMQKFPEAFCSFTANLTNISKYEDGRTALLRHSDTQSTSGLGALIRSLRSRDGTVVIYSITAIHNLLLDRRPEIQEEAKNQVKKYKGIPYIVELLNICFDEALDNQCFKNYKFKVVVLDCIQILAYGNRENRLAIRESDGPKLILKNIKDYFNQQSEDLLETASRVLKSLSACPANKIEIINNDGINVLFQCIHRDNLEILKTCLWTLRNLSDLINNTVTGQGVLINRLVQRLLEILDRYVYEPCITTCALGTLANLTCNNEKIKSFVCEYGGVEQILNTVDFAMRDLNSSDFHIIDREILDPAVCALCHLLNQTHYPRLEDAKRKVRDSFDLFKPLIYNTRDITDDLAKAVDKLNHLALGYTESTLHYQ